MKEMVEGHTAQPDAPNPRSRGFTFVEMMVTVSVISILAAIAIPSYIRYQWKSRIAEVDTLFGGIRASQVSFHASNNEFANVTRAAPGNVPPTTATAWPLVPCPANCGPATPQNCNEFDCIGFRPSGGTQFIYRSPHVPSRAGQPSEFCIEARGDLDRDGDELNFEWQSDLNDDGAGNSAPCNFGNRGVCEPGTFYPEARGRCDPEDW